MFKALLTFSKNRISSLFEKLPYRFKYVLFYTYKLIEALPTLIRFIFLDISYLDIVGSSISLEASSMCQLKCPICPTGKGINKEGSVGWGYLKFKNFKNFVNINPGIRNIELPCWGEIFLNPELKQIIKYAYNKKINLTAIGGVNLNTATKDMLESLVKYKFKYFTISLDGATNKTYQIYRQGGDFNKVIKNIKIINFFKRKYNSKFPILAWQFVIMGHNEHEIPIARKMAQKLGMKFITKLNRVSSYSPIKDKKFVRKANGLGVATREEFFQKYKQLYIPNCRRLWNRPQINWDGKLLGCSDNIWDDYGNVFETSLKKCLNSKRYLYTKQMLLGKKKLREDIPCFKCPKYKFIQEKPLKKRDIIVNFDLI